MGLLRRKAGPEGLSLTVVETYFIVLQDKGAVALGALEGTGTLRPGDVALAAGREWPVLALEGFGRMFREAGAGTNVGLVFGMHLPKETFDGAVLTFRRG